MSLRTLIVLQHQYDLLGYAETHTAHYDDAGRRQTQTLRLLQHFDGAGIRSLDFGYIVQDGTPGPAHLVHTTAALTEAISDDVAAWFAHQRRLAAGDVADVPLELAPGLRLVDVAERAADGATSAVCYVAPGPASLHQAGPVSRGAFALLVRVAAGGLRPRDVTEPDAVRELSMLLQLGLILLAATS
jgi:hypothetical protein